MASAYLTDTRFFCCIFNFLILALLSIHWVACLIRVKCMLERWSILVVLFYILSAVLRAGHWVTYLVLDAQNPLVNNIITSVDEIAEIISWAILIYFLFQMIKLRDKFQSSGVEEYKQRQKRAVVYSRLAYTWIVISSLTSGALIVYVVVVNDNPTFGDRITPMGLFYFDMTVCVIEAIIELLIAYSFYRVFSFFIWLKVNKLRTLCLELTLANRLVIIWIMALIVMNSLSAVCRLF